MSPAETIARLRQDLLPLQGFRPMTNGQSPVPGLGAINRAFPNGRFPLGTIHEFLSHGPENAAASSGFITGMVSALMQSGGAAVWISPSRLVFPPALQWFGITPDRVIFLELPKEKDRLWATEEALSCSALSAVVAEIPGINFTQSRRLQLAVEQSQVTGFILRKDLRQPQTTACMARWQVTPLPSEVEEALPGIGFPRWEVELLKAKNGKPGIWELAWAEGRFRQMENPQRRQLIPMVGERKQKTG